MRNSYYCPNCHNIMNKGGTYKRTTYHYAGALTHRCCKNCAHEVLEIEYAILYLHDAINRLEESVKELKKEVFEEE